MERRALGRSGIAVSRVVLGCRFGSGQRGEAARASAFALMDRALDLGITTFDAGDAPDTDAGEALIGAWLATKGPAARERIAVQTRTSDPVGRAGRGLGRVHVRRRLDAALARLGLEQVALYLAHAFDADVPQEETLLAFDELRRDGKIGTAGVAGFTGEQLAEALEIAELEGLGRYEVVQNRFSLLQQLDRETVFPVCHEHGIGYQPSSPLAGGRLAGGGPGDGALGTFRDRARLLGVSAAALALAWVLRLPEATGVVVRPTRLEQLDEVEQALHLRLGTAEATAIAGLFA